MGIGEGCVRAFHAAGALPMGAQRWVLLHVKDAHSDRRRGRGIAGAKVAFCSRKPNGPEPRLQRSRQGQSAKILK